MRHALVVLERSTSVATVVLNSPELNQK